MPLIFVEAGKIVKVLRVSGTAEVKKHLEDLGFVAGTEVEVVQSQGGNLIVNVKGSRLAITKELAQKITVS
ncbi:MAG: ferrous iron transport protein A [Lachnospiraceae bacterium]|nr:ferrous iron transport protein A [Lachnospiraceae bacterium]